LHHQRIGWFQQATSPSAGGIRGRRSEIKHSAERAAAPGYAQD
jgi:hypothetical protein